MSQFCCLAMVLAMTGDFDVVAIDPENVNPSSAALDVNGDGQLDILAGRFWYAGPQWQRHFLRDVQEIRGRQDDYSNLQFDVDGDGRSDLISCNYRSRSIYWLRNTGTETPWPRQVIAEPGLMETGRLLDVNQDGQLDILPNGTDFAAWWSLDRTADPPAWQRHDLPEQLVGHGIGFGDLDGDGRGDFVSPRGWLRITGDSDRPWQWMPEFRLHRDGSIPILVHDVDRDGDSDIVWGRAHQVGLYWLEQHPAATGDRRWTQHTIDTQITQAHSIVLADLNPEAADGPEILAGCRWMGHDGRDIGENNPLAVYAYTYAPELRTFRRRVVSQHPLASFGMDPKVLDIDGDGDIDVLGAGRNGLYLFRNNQQASPDDRPAIAGPALPAPAPATSLLEVARGPGAREPIRSATEWGWRRAAILAGLQQAMGPLPDTSRRVPLRPEVISKETLEHYVRTKLWLRSEAGDRIPALLLRPQPARQNSAAMLCLHQTTDIGKDEPAGLGGNQDLHFAHELALRGYVCLVPDYPSFGDYEYDFAADDYVSGSMKAIWNNLRCVDYLETLADVDPDRIGCIGHSLGGHNALFTAAFDLRLKAVVTSCGFTPFHDYYQGRLEGWTSERYMPRIRTEYDLQPDRMPFDFYGVLGAIAPRGIFINAPLHDSNFDVGGVRKVVSQVEPIYALYPRPRGLTARYPDAGHSFPPEVREEAYAWLDQQLKD